MELPPDSAHLAILAGAGAVRQLQIRNTSDLKILAIVPVDKFKIRSLVWAGPDHLLILYSQTTYVWGLEGPTYEFVTLKGEDPWGSRSETLLQLLEAWIRFLEAHNPPDPPSAAAKVATESASPAVAH